MKFYRPIGKEAKIIVIDSDSVSAIALYEKFKRDLDTIEEKERWAFPIYTELGTCPHCSDRYNCEREDDEFCFLFDDRSFAEQIKDQKEYRLKLNCLRGKTHWINTYGSIDGFDEQLARSCRMKEGTNG